MMRPTTYRTAINGVQLEVRSRGAGEPDELAVAPGAEPIKNTVVFVHGSMGDECAAVLAEPTLANHYRLIDYHRRGYGSSEHPDDPVTIAQQAADCRAVMHHFGVKRAHWVGQSYGGAIILQLALDAPDAVQSLALLEPALPAVLFNSPEVGAFFARVTPLYASGDKAGAIDAFAQEVAGAEYRAHFDQTLPPGHFERWVTQADTIFQSDMPALQSWQFTRQEAVQITQPVLNVRGEHTTAYFREVYETIRAWLPQAENFVLPNAPHTMLQSNPQGIAACLASFFARHPLSAS